MTFLFSRFLQSNELLNPSNRLSNDFTIVGWGTQASFFEKKRIFNGLYYRKIDALIDSDHRRHNKTVGGIKIHPIDYLNTLSPKTTVVVIFSMFVSEIANELEALGFFNYTIPASKNMLNIAENASHVKNKKKSTKAYNGFTDTAVICSGLIEPDLTFSLIKSLRLQYPNIGIYVSTWQDTDERWLNNIKQYNVNILKYQDIQFPGHHNRNRQSYLTHKALLAAKHEGYEIALKVRPDIFFHHDNILQHLKEKMLLDQNKIIISESFSRLFFPLHPSDFLMYGHIDRLINFWDTGHQDRRKPNSINMSIWDYCMSGYIPECAFTLNYLSKNHIPVPETFDEALEIFSKLFTIINNDQIDLFWYKMLLDFNPPTIGMCLTEDIRNKLDQPQNRALVGRIADPTKITIRDFHLSKYKWRKSKNIVQTKLKIESTNTNKLIITGYEGIHGFFEMFKDKVLHYIQNP